MEQSNDTARAGFAQDYTEEFRRRTTGPHAAGDKGVAGEISPADGVDSPSRRAKNAKVFVKLHDRGAHKMVTTKIFNRATQVLMLLIRDARYGGRCYTTPTIIADEIGMDASDVRKIIKTLEGEQMIMRMHEGCSHPYYLLNPYYITVGDEQSEEIACAIWARERTKRIKARDKATA